MTNIANRVREIVGMTAGSAVGIEDHLFLVHDLGFDSLDAMGVVVDLEKEFRIDIDDECIEQWRTVGDVIQTVQGLVS